MKYEGNLYGKVGNKYIPLVLTSDDVVEKPTEEELHFLESLLETQIQTCEMVIRNTAKWEKQDLVKQAEREVILSNQLLEKVRKM